MRKINIEKLSQYAIILIALSALFVSIWQINISHKHNKLSVEPYLDYHLDQSNATLTVKFSNQGFGPAIVKKITYIYKNKTYNSLEDFLNDSGEISNRLESFQYGANTIIASGEKKLLVKLKGSKIRGVRVNIIYKTVYKDQKEFNFKF